jgi:uncharacterized protein
VRLAIISDTHMPRGARRLPDACVERLRAADAILHCGDWMRAEVVTQIAGYGPPVYGIRGNVDERGLALPARRQETLGGATFGMVHDPGPSRGRLERLRGWFPETDAVLFGHTHQPQHETADDGFQIFNPGSPTERRRAPRHSMGEAQVRDGRIAFELIEWT